MRHTRAGLTTLCKDFMPDKEMVQLMAALKAAVERCLRGEGKSLNPTDKLQPISYSITYRSALPEGLNRVRCAAVALEAAFQKVRHAVSEASVNGRQFLPHHGEMIELVA